MKKLFYGMALGCSVLMLAGCGDVKESESKEEKESSKIQTVSCTMEQTEEGSGKISMTMNFDYNKKEKQMTAGKYVVIYELESSDLLSDFEKVNLCESLAFDDEGVYKDCKTKTEGNTITINMNIDVDALEESSKDDDEDERFTKDLTPDALKTMLEKESFTCSIK